MFFISYAIIFMHGIIFLINDSLQDMDGIT